MPTVEERTETVFIGPDVAEKMLKKNTKNRPVSHARIARYAKAMREGRWHFTGDAIQQDWNEDLLNGQQRLHAIVISNTTQKFNLVTGLPPEAQRYMDQGRARSAGNQLSIEGVMNATQAASIVRVLLAWSSNSLVSAAKGIFGATDEVVEFAHANHEELQHIVVLANRVRKNIPVPAGPTGAVIYRARQLDHEAVDEFFEELATGAGLEIGSPILTFRNHMIKLRNTRARRINAEVIYLLVVTWNAWRADRMDMTRIQLPKGGVTDAKIPVML